MKNQILGLSLLSAVLAMPASTASAQGTLEDYNRAYALRHQFSADSVFHWARSSAWCDSTHVLHYQISTPQGRKFVSYDADKDEMKTYDSQEAMEKALGIKSRPSMAVRQADRRVPPPYCCMAISTRLPIVPADVTTTGWIRSGGTSNG